MHKYKIVYVSKTGFTKQYAEYIASALNVKAELYKKGTNTKEYSKVIFCSFVFGGNISELADIKNEVDKDKLFVLATGIYPPSPQRLSLLAKDNRLDESRLYYVSGGLDFSKLNFIKKAMLKMVRSTLEKKSDRSADDNEALRRLTQGGCFVDLNSSNPLIKDVLDER